LNFFSQISSDADRSFAVIRSTSTWVDTINNELRITSVPHPFPIAIWCDNTRPASFPRR
jgi:hypothetical protein